MSNLCKKNFFNYDYLNKYEKNKLDINILEIGFGDGENLIHLSQKFPSSNFYGAEVYHNGILKVLKQIQDLKLNNIKIWPEDIRLIIDNFPKNFFDYILILHPDPWPKSKHSKRRLLQQGFISKLSQATKVKGKIIVSSDHNIMKSWILEQFHKRDDIIWYIKKLNFLKKKPKCLIETKYYKKAFELGRSTSWFVFKKIT